MGGQFRPNTSSSSRISEVGSKLSASKNQQLSDGQKQLITLYKAVIKSNSQDTTSLNKELEKKNKLDLVELINKLNQGLDKLSNEGKQQLITSEGTSENKIIVSLLKIINHELEKNPDRQQSIKSSIEQLRNNLGDAMSAIYIKFDPLRSDASLIPSKLSHPKR